MSPLAALHAAALASDETRDWRAFYQAFAGTALVVPITGEAQLALDAGADPPMAHAFISVEAYAEGIAEAAGYAELPGSDLARVLADAEMSLEILGAGAPIVLTAGQLGWIADTYGAAVEQATGQGVTVSAPGTPPPDLIEVIGQSVAALGPACREAWLVEMATPGEEPELVLVLGLAEDARAMEERLAETLTRAVQAVSHRPFAVACPDPDAPLAQRAREVGIGVTG